MWLFDISKLMDMEFEQSMKNIFNFAKWTMIVAFLAIIIEIIAYYNCWIENIRDIIQTTIGAFAFISFYIAILNLCLNRIHKKTSIEIEKRHRTIDLLMKWSMENTPEALISRKIVDRMDKKERFKLADGNERVVISRVDYNVLSSLLPEKILQKKSYLPRCGIFKATHRQRGKRVDLDNDEIELSLQETMWLRSNVVKYMNILEIIMYAWAADDVSRDIIEKEFSYLVTTERDGNVVLKEFRMAMGNENYPAINAFCQEMEERNKKRILQIKERV